MEAFGRALDLRQDFEDYFVENYSTIVNWARMIAKNDHAIAQDIVHEVYLKVADLPVDTVTVSNQNGYLYTALRNTYRSKLRRQTRLSEVALIENGAPEAIDRTTDPRIEHAVRELLLEICHFACKRKRSSISASILILRYFHGYYTAETAKLLNRSRNSIEARLAYIRSEVREYLKSPDRFNTHTSTNSGDLDPVYSRVFDSDIYDSDVLTEIRRRVFRQWAGKCRGKQEWRRFYKRNQTIGRDELSHLVSCRKCLDQVNEILGIPLLAQRHPLDARGFQSVVEAITRCKDSVAHAILVLFFMLSSPDLLDLMGDLADLIDLVT